MSLVTGSRLGPYEVLDPLGAGGMGEVYRAHDNRLNRNVAIKVLHESFAADPERLARFRREAQMLAAVSHPNIAQIHGVEVSGDVHALVMELVDGATLAEQIADGRVGRTRSSVRSTDRAGAPPGVRTAASFCDRRANRSPARLVGWRAAGNADDA